MLRKFLKTVTEGLAFLARSLVFLIFAHLFALYGNKKSNNQKFKVLRRNLAMKYQINR